MANIRSYLKARKPFQNPRDLWWFPMVVFTIGVLSCFSQLSLEHASPTAMTWYAVGAAVPILLAEIATLFYYNTMQNFKILNMEIGVGFHALVNCGLFVASIGIAALNQKSLASILFFYFTAAAMIAGERLLEAKTDFGLFRFFCGCSVTQANLYFGFGPKFWLFAGIVWFLQATRGYLLKFYSTPVPASSVDTAAE